LDVRFLKAAISTPGVSFYLLSFIIKSVLSPMANWMHGVGNHYWSLGLERLYITPQRSLQLAQITSELGVFDFFVFGWLGRVIVIASCSALVAFVQHKL
jgi:hypothetical protein